MFALVLGYGDERTLGDYTTNLSSTHNEKSVDVPTGDIREDEGMYAVNEAATAGMPSQRWHGGSSYSGNYPRRR